MTGRAPGGAVHLDDVVHLLRFGVRLDEVAARLGVSVAAVLRAVQRAVGRAPDGVSDLDVAALRRLVAADRARAWADAQAAWVDRARAWRWAS